MTAQIERPLSTELHLIDRFEQAHRRARADGRPVLASLTRAIAPLDPLALFDRAGSRTAERVFWRQPSEGFALVGLGAAQEIAPTGPARFARAGSAWRALLDGALIECPPASGPGTGPLLLGGFAFDPERPPTGQWRSFPDAWLMLPRVLLTQNMCGSWLTLNAVLHPDSDPVAEAMGLLGEHEWVVAEPPSPPAPLPMLGEGGRNDEGRLACLGSRLPSRRIGRGAGGEGGRWQSKVSAAARAVRDGALEKVVLAREVRVEAAGGFDVTAALAWLGEAYPTCYSFAIARGGQTFLGATPERLVRLEDGAVRATCLAGSRRRGETPEEDRRLGAELLASQKDRREHAVVVRVLTEGLSELCDELSAPSEPSLLSVTNVHHLYTPVTACLRDGYTLLDAVERLHPTPAVGGFPREAALRYIREHEDLDRGWYAAPIGWMDAQGGEFAVALRSALVEDGSAALFAGCGIMGDSDPEQEYAESSVKLRPMCAALERAGQPR